MASISIVLLRMLLRRGIESPEQLEEVGINVYASIPVSDTLSNYNQKKGIRIRADKLEHKSFLAIDNPADIAIETIRGLRTSLHFAMMEARNNILMISGASPNAGKTFVSTNLAAVIAQTGKKFFSLIRICEKGMFISYLILRMRMACRIYYREVLILPMQSRECLVVDLII